MAGICPWAMDAQHSIIPVGAYAPEEAKLYFFILKLTRE